MHHIYSYFLLFVIYSGKKEAISFGIIKKKLDFCIEKSNMIFSTYESITLTKLVNE